MNQLPPPSRPPLRAGPFRAVPHVKEEGAEVAGTNGRQAQRPEVLNQLSGAQHPVPCPQGRRQSLQNLSRDTFQIGYDDHQPAARPYQSQMFGDDGAGVFKMLDEAGRVNQIEMLSRE